MQVTNYIIEQAGKVVDLSCNLELAVIEATARAQQTGAPVSVIACLGSGSEQEATFNPDGTNERIWAIDNGKPLQPEVGRIYTNRGAGQYKCIALTDDGNAFGIFQSVKSGWTFTAEGTIQYIDGTIEWDRSIDGHFEEIRAYTTERIKMVKAMEYIMRNVNDETVFDEWLAMGVADGDIDYGDLSANIQNADELDDYTDDKAFGELMQTFLRCMSAARKSGGLYCDGVVSGKARRTTE